MPEINFYAMKNKLNTWSYYIATNGSAHEPMTQIIFGLEIRHISLEEFCIIIFLSKSLQMRFGVRFPSSIGKNTRILANSKAIKNEFEFFNNLTLPFNLLSFFFFGEFIHVVTWMDENTTNQYCKNRFWWSIIWI